MNYNKEEILNLQLKMVAVSKKMYERRLVSGTAGNLSSRIPRDPEHILIKVSGKCLGDVDENDFVIVDLDGNVIYGVGRPSIEVKFHCGIYKVRPEVNALVHGHSPYATSYVIAKGTLPVVTVADEAGLNKIGIIDFARPGSEKLAEIVVEKFKDKTLNAAVMQKHGFITLGKDIDQALYLADMLEDNAQIAWLLEK